MIRRRPVARVSFPVACRAGVVGFAMLAAVGCQTTVTTSDGTPPAPKPTEAPATPRESAPNAIAVTFAPKPTDTNGNLLPDSLGVTAYLFSKPHPAPFHADGRFVFAIYAAGEAGSPGAPVGKPLREWSFGVSEVAAARTRALAGPCHEFTLSLLADGGSDVLPVESVDLVAWFEPSEGTGRVWMNGVRGVQFARPVP